MTERRDALVLGAGIVGVSVALHLQARGMSTVLVDKGEAGGETSYGNAGFIELSSVVPHPFPRGLRNLITLALNRSDAVRTDPALLPAIAPWLFSYWDASRAKRLPAIAAAFRALLNHSLAEHEALMQAAGASDLLRRDGWLELCRNEAQLADADQAAEAARALGIAAPVVDAKQLAGLVPSLLTEFAGAIHWADTARVVDPGGLTRALSDLFVGRGGTFIKADAMGLKQAGRWRLETGAWAIEADHAVVALGPWSGELAGRFGYRLPLAAKRGYHRHFAQPAGAALGRPIYVRDGSCLIVPTKQGIRLLSGVELARRDAPPSPIQIARLTEVARRTIALGEAIEPRPWMGARPCMPDMLPVIGQAPRHRGLWFAFGHGHYGFTLGPITGRLIAELITGAEPMVETEPYRVERYRRH
jgi:D-amino-acid dehydrogenase